jgi:hypothetical protein
MLVNGYLQYLGIIEHDIMIIYGDEIAYLILINNDLVLKDIMFLQPMNGKKYLIYCVKKVILTVHQTQ